MDGLYGRKSLGFVKRLKGRHILEFKRSFEIEEEGDLNNLKGVVGVK